MITIVTSCVASDGEILDGYGNVLCKIGPNVKVILEGEDITMKCAEVIEFSDGKIQAVCFVKKGEEYVFEYSRPKREVLTGRGHVFYPGCCE